MAGNMWVYDPQSGGVPIRDREKQVFSERLQRHAQQHFAGRYQRLDIRFKGAFCYIDAYEEQADVDRGTPTHLCRLRHFTAERWSLAVYTYSNEKYEPCVFPNGEMMGSLEDGFDVGAEMYLN